MTYYRHRRAGRASLPASFSASSFGCRRVERKVEGENVDPRLAQESEQAALRVLGDQIADALLRHVTRLGDSRHLEQRSLGRNVGVETAGRGGDEIDRHGLRRILRLKLLDI